MLLLAYAFASAFRGIVARTRLLLNICIRCVVLTDVPDISATLSLIIATSPLLCDRLVLPLVLRTI